MSRSARREAINIVAALVGPSTDTITLLVLAGNRRTSSCKSAITGAGTARFRPKARGQQRWVRKTGATRGIMGAAMEVREAVGMSPWPAEQCKWFLPEKQERVSQALHLASRMNLAVMAIIGERATVDDTAGIGASASKRSSARAQ